MAGLTTGVIVVNMGSDEEYLMDVDTGRRIECDERVVRAYANQLARANELSRKLGESQRENARLRELVGVLMHCMQLHKECDECRLNGSKGEVALDPLCACDGLHELLRELGVEVAE